MEKTLSQQKPEPPPEEPLVLSEERRAYIKGATGTTDQGLQIQLLEQVSQFLWIPEGLSKKDGANRVRAAVTLLADISPQEGIESMLAVQMVAVHHATMECFRRAMHPRQASKVRDQELKHAAKLLSLYTRQLEALDKHRGKGQQKVTVEYVHVGAGGQAIVGHVDANARRAGLRRREPPAGNGTGAESSEHIVDSSTPNSPPVRRRFRQ